MANADAPRGLWPVRHLSGGCPQRANEYPIAAAYSTKVHTGALVKLVAGGGIEVAAAGNRLLGVFAGVQYTDSQGNPVFKKFWDGPSGATNIKAMVYDDPDLVFGIQASGTVSTGDMPVKPSGAIPTTGRPTPFTSSTRPMTLSSAPSARVQKPCESTTTGALPGATLSPGRSTRPTRGDTPSTSK